MSDTPSSPQQDPSEASFQSTEGMFASQTAAEPDILAQVQAELAALQAKTGVKLIP